MHPLQWDIQRFSPSAAGFLQPDQVAVHIRLKGETQEHGSEHTIYIWISYKHHIWCVNSLQGIGTWWDCFEFRVNGYFSPEMFSCQYFSAEMPQAAIEEYKCNGDLRVLGPGRWRCRGQLSFVSRILKHLFKICVFKQILEISYSIGRNNGLICWREWFFAGDKITELWYKGKATDHHQTKELLQEST